jgi:bacterioferritin
MKGSQRIIDFLNNVLTKELTAINQYFLHARILEDWGLKTLGGLEYKASLDEMKHADDLIKRTLFLEGLPNVQKLEKINIGQTIQEILKSDLNLEYAAVPYLKEAITAAEEEKDFVSRDLFQSILNSEEEHVDWLETQHSLLEKLGEQNYLQSALGPALTE